MKLCATKDGGWALVDESTGTLRHLAGGLNAWAPRLTCGEGEHVLPCTGRVGAQPADPCVAGQVFERVFHLEDAAEAPDWSLAAVVGATLMGRQNPVRSILGYIAVRRNAGKLEAGPCIVTREDFGDLPTIGCGLHGTPLDVAERMVDADRRAGLRTGDLVVFGKARISTRQTSRLGLSENPPSAPRPAELPFRPIPSPPTIMEHTNMDTPAFDDRDGWIWLDGVFVPWREARLHVLSHALHYASSVFEGARMYDGRIFALAAHNERLAASARALNFDLPYSVEALNEACLETCARNGLTDAYVRPVAWRGAEEIGVSARQTQIHVAIAAWSWPSYFKPEERSAGIRLCWARYKRPSPETGPVQAKAAGLYMICTVEKHAAQAAGYADALMLDYRGYVAEATGANVFFVKDGALHTPKADCFLNGITRRAVIDLARARGLQIIERHIPPQELATFSECFLTGTAAEVTPVASVGPFHFTPGEISLGLMADYESLVRRAPAVEQAVA